MNNVFKQDNIRWDEIGLIGKQSSKEVVDAAHLVKKGSIYTLGTERFMHMPGGRFAPPFMIYTMHSAKGTQNAKRPEREWIWNEKMNEVQIGFNADYIMAGSHTGTHIDSLAHVTVGNDAHWFNGYTSEKFCSDNGVLKCDASSMLPVFTRGVLLDVAKYLNFEKVPDTYVITKDTIKNMLREQKIEISSGNVLLFHTGYENDYPMINDDSKERCGLDLSAAEFISKLGVVAVGIDNEFLDCVPSRIKGNAYPVHLKLLNESGIHIMENVLTKKLSEDQQYEFLFVALPLTNRGATASMINPIAVV